LKPVRKRQLVDHARTTWQVSNRRACRLLPVERSTYHYRSRRAGAKWACNCGTRHRSAESRQSCARIGNRPRSRTRPGQWTSPMISLRPDGSCGCSPSLTRSRASRRRSNLGSTSAALMLWRYLKRSAEGNPGQSRDRICLTRSRPLGLSAWCHARLLPTGQAD
jgi:hypothetical protein